MLDEPRLSARGMPLRHAHATKAKGTHRWAELGHSDTPPPEGPSFGAKVANGKSMEIQMGCCDEFERLSTYCDEKVRMEYRIRRRP
jgi:hypothetical protein